MTRHTVRSFDDALKRVSADLLRMGQLVEDELAAAILQLDNDPQRPALPMRDLEDWVDLMNEKIDDEVQHTLATRQPVAADLRALISSSRIATELERVGDHAKNIARRSIVIQDQGIPMDFHRVRTLAEQVQVQLRDILAAIEQGDAEEAKRIWAKDSVIDALYDDAFGAHLGEICVQEENSMSCTQLLFIAKSLERMGDHVTNIAEDLVYWFTGSRLNRKRVAEVSVQS